MYKNMAQLTQDVPAQAIAHACLHSASVFKQRVLVCVIAALCALCAFCFSACASADENNLVGEWKIQDTDVTVVFSGTEFKLVGNTFDYKLDPSNKTITYSAGDATGTATYSFGENNRQLTLEESDGAGGTKVTVFDKVSSNGDAEPTANGVADEG